MDRLIFIVQDFIYPLLKLQALLCLAANPLVLWDGLSMPGLGRGRIRDEGVAGLER